MKKLVQNLMYNWVKLEKEDSDRLNVMEKHKPAYLKLDKHRICVVRLESGWFGVHNVCPHAGVALHGGFCNKKGIVACPAHGYKFNVKNGKSIDGNDYYLKTYKIEKREEDFYVGIKKF